VKFQYLAALKKHMSITDKLAQMKADKAAENLQAGEEFLASNKSKEGVVTLDSGLQYQVLKEGTGEKPKATDTVKCHYHGTLIDGTIFDSSVQRGTPAKFPLNMVIKGWTEGVQLMSEGSKWRFFIPADLGYGNRQVSAQIGPNCALIFDVELLEIM
jgi:FKBP-type peptidyl-prolyl cis-trans isomerase FklB